MVVASGNISVVAETNTLSHGEEPPTFGDARYQGVQRRVDAKEDVTWHIVMRAGKAKALYKEDEADALID